MLSEDPAVLSSDLASLIVLAANSTGQAQLAYMSRAGFLHGMGPETNRLAAKLSHVNEVRMLIR